MSQKTFKFQLPDRMYEEFYRLFSEIGERSRFLRKVISLAIQRGSDKERFAEEIERQAMWKGTKARE